MAFIEKNDEVENLLRKLAITANQENELVSVEGCEKQLECIGIGTDAAVFRYEKSPSFAYKVYAFNRIEKMDAESQVYQILGKTDYFPIFYGKGENYLILSYEPGITLYDCLLKGIHIPKQVILDVDEIRQFVTSKGLNPRDIHLKNILMQGNRAKIIDVSEYMKPGNDQRWEYLKRGYNEIYPLIDEKVIPYWVIEKVKKWYNQTNTLNFDFPDFLAKAKKLLS